MVLPSLCLMFIVTIVHNCGCGLRRSCNTPSCNPKSCIFATSRTCEELISSVQRLSATWQRDSRFWRRDTSQNILCGPLFRLCRPKLLCYFKCSLAIGTYKSLVTHANTTHINYAQWPVSHTNDTHHKSHVVCTKWL